MLLFYIKKQLFYKYIFCKKAAFLQLDNCKKAVFLQLDNCKNAAFLHKKAAFLQIYIFVKKLLFTII